MPEPLLDIALISEHADPLAPVGGPDSGGQNVYVRALAESLAALGHRVTVYTRWTDPAQRDPVPLAHGAVVEHLPVGPPVEMPKDELRPFMGDFGAHLAAIWQGRPPDIAHAHYWMSGIATLSGRGRSPMPVVQTFHALAAASLRHLSAPPDVEERWDRAGGERAVGQIADAIVALTDEEVADLVGEGIPRDRVHVVPCGVDVDAFSPAGPSAARGTRPRVVTLSRLVSRKGVDTVIAALARVPDAELVVAGGPPRDRLPHDPEYLRLTSAAHRHGVADRVVFLGGIPRSEVPELLRSADVFVTAPTYEPFGMAALEAAACGVPVVASDVGGLRETVVHGATGFLVPVAEPVALAERLGALLAEEPLRRAFGKAAAERAAAFAWPLVTARVLDVYRSLM